MVVFVPVFFFLRSGDFFLLNHDPVALTPDLARIDQDLRRKPSLNKEGRSFNWVVRCHSATKHLVTSDTTST